MARDTDRFHAEHTLQIRWCRLGFDQRKGESELLLRAIIIIFIWRKSVATTGLKRLPLWNL